MMLIFPRLLQVCLILFVIAILMPSPVLAGTANDPEIRSRQDTSALLRGEVIPHLEITKGWIYSKEDRFNFVMEVASLPPVEDIPKDSVYVFHYSIPDVGRLYFRANWSADQSEFELFGGVYAGCEPQFCPPFDEQGNRNYLYLPGNSSQKQHIEGKVIPGAPGRITWSYPMSAYGDGDEKPRWLEMKGLFAATYTFTENRSIRYADVTMGNNDYRYSKELAWHEQLLARIPGPSPAILLLGTFLVAAALKQKRSNEQTDGAAAETADAANGAPGQKREGDTL